MQMMTGFYTIFETLEPETSLASNEPQQCSIEQQGVSQDSELS
jgi:hypothetical protein